MLSVTLSLLLFLAVSLSNPLLFVYAQTATSIPQDPLQAQIDASSAQIAKLKQEITQLQTQLTTTSKEKQTLQSAIAALNLNIKKISTTTTKLEQIKMAVGDSLQELQVLDDEPLAFFFLAGNSLSSFFDEAEKLSAIRIGLGGKIRQLSSLK